MRPLKCVLENIPSRDNFWITKLPHPNKDKLRSSASHTTHTLRFRLGPCFHKIIQHVDLRPGQNTLNMAIARPVRVLGLAAVMMWCFFLYQVFSPGSPLPLPSSIPQNEKEPLLDRESHPFKPFSHIVQHSTANLVFAPFDSNRRATRTPTSHRSRICARCVGIGAH